MKRLWERGRIFAAMGVKEYDVMNRGSPWFKLWRTETGTEVEEVVGVDREVLRQRDRRRKLIESTVKGKTRCV